MPVLLALIAAAGFGVSDFLAGVLSRRASVLLVALIGQTTSTALTWCAVAPAGGVATGTALAWGALAGCGASGGALFLYRGLARGRMSIVGPVSAVVTATLSAVAGIALGDRPSAVAIGGMVLACVAIGLVSATDTPGPEHDARELRRSLANAVAAGLGFTLFFVALHRAGTGAGLWPVALSQSSGLLLVAAGAAVVLASRHAQVKDLRRVFPSAMLVGVLGGGATVAYFAATQLGLLSVSAVITSLYPAATVAPAMIFLHERVRTVQTVGLLLAALAVVLLAL